MNWLNLSNRYLNLAHVVSVTASSANSPYKPVAIVATVDGGCFELRGDDAEVLLIALEQEVSR